MEIIDLAEKRKAFMPSKDRYKYPHREAMNLRLLWTYNKRPSKSRDAQQVRCFYKEACDCLESADFEKGYRLIAKGLFLDPRFHPFYAIKGDMFMRQEKWTGAIRSYENARSTTKFDKTLSEAEARLLYNRQLVESYRKRGNWYCDNGLLFEALADYEQALLLKLRGMSVIDIEDKLLGILRSLNKYEAFQFYWNQFIIDADETRASILLTEHADFKIHLRQMAEARRILFDALNVHKNNVKTQELLQVVYNTGHTMAAYTVIWCMHGCYDKALLTIEKGRECDPYNPGYTLLKTIVLRLSGRLAEADAWLENVNKSFHKLLEPTRDRHGSIMGKLSIEETRNELLKQWHLIRYDMAMSHTLHGNYEGASQVIRKSNLTNYYAESYLLLGDGFLLRENSERALEMYLRCRESRRQLGVAPSRRTIDLAERIIDILIDRAKVAAREKRSNDAIAAAEKALRILDEDRIDLHRLGAARGRALFHKAHALFQIAEKEKSTKKYCETAADSLKFVRDADDDLYGSLFAEIATEDVIDRFAPKRKLPQSLKILMQYS